MHCLATMTRPIGLILVGWLMIVHETAGDTLHNKLNSCNLPRTLKAEIDSYAPNVARIINEALYGSFKGSTWRDLALFTDTFGPRFSGSRVLEDSIDYVLNKSIAYGLENVHGEPVQLPHWIRGSESATLLRPRRKNMAILGLGYSVGTPEKGITAQAILVKNYTELRRRAREVRGKIVVYNLDYISFEKSLEYLVDGASRAAEFGAVAALLRSATPFSLYTPHTMVQIYGPNVTKIPVACITVEDARFLQRIVDRGQVIEINLKMQARTLPDVQSRNLIAEIRGWQHPEKVVVISGHIDSWDVGEGAMDDGGGAFISWKALQLLHHLNFRPRRTIRMIMWTGEEMGILGAEHYINAHDAERRNLQFVMESDVGTFMPLGIRATATDYVMCILHRVTKLLSPMGPMNLTTPFEGPDILYWVEKGVPGGAIWTKNDKYFYYHHTEADTMDVEDPEALDRGTAIFAAVSYVVADMSVDFPHRIIPSSRK